MIKPHKLRVGYSGPRALDGVNCSLARTNITALIAPNSAGKTRLLRCLAAPTLVVPRRRWSERIEALK